MPSVCPSSEESHHSSLDSSRPNRRRHLFRRTPRLPNKLARLFHQPDAAESFMQGWLARFHGEYPNHYTVLSVRRTTSAAGAVVRRLIIEAAMFQPQRRGASAEWLVIHWYIDGPSVVFHRCPTKKAAIGQMRREPIAIDLPFAPAAIDDSTLVMTGAR